MYATDRRTDGRTKATLNAPYPTGGGISAAMHREPQPVPPGKCNGIIPSHGPSIVKDFMTTVQVVTVFP